MPIYMYQAAYTPESWAAQLKNPQNRVDAVGRAACEAVGGKLVGGWYCFGDYDLVIIADVPDNESMSAIALAIAAGGAVKASKTTVLMTGAEAVGEMKRRTPSPRSTGPPDKQVAELREPPHRGSSRLAFRRRLAGADAGARP